MLSQVVAGVLQAQTRYTLTVDVARDNSYPVWAYDFGLISGDLVDDIGPILALSTGSTDLDGSTIPSAQFRTLSLVFETGLDTVGIGRQFAIGLSGRGETNNRIAYDNIRLDVTSLTSAVPEASTWAMMIVGFGAMGTALRRRMRVGAWRGAALVRA